MADLKISQLNEITEISGNEMLPAAVSGGNGRISMSRMKEYVSSESGSYKVNLGKLMEDSPSAAEVSDAIGGWDNLVSAVNDRKPVIGYHSGRFTTAVHCEIMSADKIILAVNSETTAIKFKITNTSGTLGCSREDTVLQTASDESLQTDDKTVAGAVNEVNGKLPLVTQVPELSADYVVPANATSREHIYEIAVGATAYGITGAEGVKWADGTPPEVSANTTVVVSVINNLAVWGTV